VVCIFVVGVALEREKRRKVLTDFVFLCKMKGCSEGLDHVTCFSSLRVWVPPSVKFTHKKMLLLFADREREGKVMTNLWPTHLSFYIIISCLLCTNSNFCFQ
jgi:hypothetical protein